MTLFGESSGGACVGFHLTSAKSQGLFARVILESPGLTQSKSWHASESNTLFAASALAGAGSPACSWPPHAAGGPGQEERVQERWRHFPGLGLGIPKAPLGPLQPSLGKAQAACAADAACALVRNIGNGSYEGIGGGVAGNMSDTAPLLFNWTAKTGNANFSVYIRIPASLSES